MARPSASDGGLMQPRALTLPASGDLAHAAMIRARFVTAPERMPKLLLKALRLESSTESFFLCPAATNLVRLAPNIRSAKTTQAHGVSSCADHRSPRVFTVEDHQRLVVARAKCVPRLVGAGLNSQSRRDLRLQQ